MEDAGLPVVVESVVVEAPAVEAPAPVVEVPVVEVPAHVAPSPVVEVPAPAVPAPVVSVPVSAMPPIIASPLTPVPSPVSTTLTVALPDINLAPIFNSIVTDITFVSNIKTAVGRIMKDGAVNETDIPDIILVILETVNLMKSVRVTTDQLSALIKMLFHYIMDSYSLIMADKKAAFDKLLDYSVRLFLLKPNAIATAKEVTNTVTNVVNEVQEVHQAARRLFPCCS